MNNVYVCYLDENDMEIVKAKWLRDGYILDKKNKRLIITTTKPLYYKKKRIYFVYRTDIHTFNPKDGKIIEEPILSFAIKLYEKKKLLEYGETSDVKIEDLSPHQLTEEVISYLVDNKIIADLLRSIQKHDWLNNILWLIMGLLAGLVLGNYIPSPGG